MIAKIANIMGVFLGPDDSLLLETDYNTKGCWEHRKLLEISDTLISSLNLYQRPFPGWEHSAIATTLAEEANGAIIRDFGNSPLWGWKDDRCSLTLPFWVNILPEVETVVCVRNPKDVARSLLKLKWDSSEEEAYSRWLIHTSSAIINTRGRKRTFVFYEDFLGDNSSLAVSQLANFLGITDADKVSQYQSLVEEFIAKDLHHFSTSLPELLDDPTVPYCVKDLYSKLRQHATSCSSTSEAPTSFDHIASYSYEEGYRTLKAAKTWAHRIAEAAYQIDELNHRLTHDKCETNDLDEEINRLKELISVLNNEIAQRDELLREREQQVADYEQQVKDLLNSKSWKITAPIRLMCDTFKQ